jgi:hypothetical protein
MGIRGRINRLRERSGLERHELVCPVYRKTFVVFGDAALEYMTADWVRKTGQPAYYQEPEDTKALFAHRHDPSELLDKRTHLPFLSREASGMSIYTDDEED